MEFLLSFLRLQFAGKTLACENSRFSALLAAGGVSRGEERGEKTGFAGEGKLSCFSGCPVNCKLRSAPSCKLGDNGEVPEEKYNQVKEKTPGENLNLLEECFKIEEYAASLPFFPPLFSWGWGGGGGRLRGI